jgi:hypothetical protein
MPGWENRKAPRCECKKPAARSRTAGVGGVVGKKCLFLEVNKGSGQLDEGLIKTPVFIRTPQPEMFEDIVRLIEALLVKTEEKSPVFSWKLGCADR